MLRPAEDASASGRLANARLASLIPASPPSPRVTPATGGDLQPYRSHIATALATAKSGVLQDIAYRLIVSPVRAPAE